MRLEPANAAREEQAALSEVQTGFGPGSAVELDRAMPHLVPQTMVPQTMIPQIRTQGGVLWRRMERPGAARPIRVGIRMNRKILFLDAAEILALEAEGNYVLVRHFKASYMARERISDLANRLEGYGFIRIHRSVLVNTVHVSSVEPLPNGDCQVQMKDGNSYAIGRSYKKNLRHIAELWMGM